MRLISFITVFAFVLIGTVIVLAKAFAPDENGEYLPTAFKEPTPQWAEALTPEPTVAIEPTNTPPLICRPDSIAPNQTDYATTVTVVEITNGDTLVVDNGAGLHVARLWGLDAPEPGQPHGADATAALHKLLPVGSNADFYEVWWDTDTLETYGIIVGRLGIANVLMLGNGWAHQSPDADVAGNRCITQFVENARKMQLGIWADPDRTPEAPWEYRQQHTPTPAPTMPPTPAGTRQPPPPFAGTPTPYPTRSPDAPTPTPPANQLDSLLMETRPDSLPG